MIHFNLRRVLSRIGILITAALLIVLLGVLILQSSWFERRIRDAIVTTVARATGGHVELGQFAFHWWTLTADMDQFVIRGSEPSGSDPLFAAQSIRTRLKILSFWKRDVNVETVVVERPVMHFIFRPDGTSNFPRPATRRPSKRTIPEQIVALRISHFEMNHGIVETELRRLPLNIRGDNLHADVQYARDPARYDVSLDSDHLSLSSTYMLPVTGDLQARMQFQSDRLVFDRVIYRFGASELHASGDLVHYADPVLHLASAGNFEASKLGVILRAPEFTAGLVAIEGTTSYDKSQSFSFKGKVSGTQIRYQSRYLNLDRWSVQSEVSANRNGLTVGHFSAGVVGAHVEGRAQLGGYRNLTVEGTVRELTLQQLSKFFIRDTLPWSGTASGPFQFHMPSVLEWRNFSLQADPKIVPGVTGIPVSGHVALAYVAPANRLEFSDAHLFFPHSALTAAGELNNNMAVELQSTDLSDITPALVLTGAPTTQLPVTLRNGRANFRGTVMGQLNAPEIVGDLDLTSFDAFHAHWDSLAASVRLKARQLSISKADLRQGKFRVRASGETQLAHWRFQETLPGHLQSTFENAPVIDLLNQYTTVRLPIIRGLASGSVNLTGTPLRPLGVAKISANSLDAYGELLNQVTADATFEGDSVRIDKGRVVAGPALMTFSTSYRRTAESWTNGSATLRLDTNGFPLASLSPVQRWAPGLNATAAAHVQGSAEVERGTIRPIDVKGMCILQKVSVQGRPIGNAVVSLATRGQAVETRLTGDVRSAPIQATALIALDSGYTATGTAQADKLSLNTVLEIIRPGQGESLPIAGTVQGRVGFHGPLANLTAMQADVVIGSLQVTEPLANTEAARSAAASPLVRNTAPIQISVANGRLFIKSFDLSSQISGQQGTDEARFQITGSTPYLSNTAPIDLKLAGGLNARLLEALNPSWQSTGQLALAGTVNGTWANPVLSGSADIRSGSFFSTSIATGLSNVNASVKFERNRATIQRFSASSGGGTVAVSGGATLGTGGLVLYQLQADSRDVRIRSASGVSITSSAALRLQGTAQSGLLTGTVTLTRAAFNPSVDLATLIASSSLSRPTPSDAYGFLNGLQFDVAVESAPDLQLDTSLSQDVQAECDLHVRGTFNRPAVLGSISVNQGDVKLFGTRYSINRGEVDFYNPARIEPVLNLDLQTEARGITVDITVSGPLSKLNINYRSDPPLQPRDIIALLAVGRAPNANTNIGSGQVSNDTSALQSGANTILGQALSPVSNRLSKLFGITNIKIDPLVQGITNTPQARLTVEQQISRQITITYITNLSQTSEQIFRLEWALNRQYSVIALRDDNGEFGVDIQFKTRFK